MNLKISFIFVKMENLRIDKYLWAVRIFKTRSLATDECNKGRVYVNGFPVKSSKTIKNNDVIQIKMWNIFRSFLVLSIIDKRVSAELAKTAIKETTDESEFEKLKQIKANIVIPQNKPDKRERRILNEFLNNIK